MDATPASASGNGFDAALKALEDLDTGGAVPREDVPAIVPGPPPPPVGVIGFSESEPESEPVAITTPPSAEAEAIEAAALPEPADPVAAAAVPVPVPPAPATGRLGKLVISLALFSSLLSAVGLIIAERTIMSARLVVADARERADQLEQANRLIRDLEIVRARQIELLAAQQAQLADAPVTSAELQRKMDALQTDLLARDPLNDVVRAIRAAQADDAARFAEFGLKVERLEAALRR